MKILEVRDGFIKFETSNRFPVTSFIKIEDENSDYIAQVIQVNKAGESVIVYAKLVFCFNGSLCEYDGTLPGKNANISEFSFNLICKDTKFKEPITIGTFVDGDTPIIAERGVLSQNLLASFETKERIDELIKNLSMNFVESTGTIVIDMQGNFNFNKTFTASKDFKLPLNSESLSFIYEDCLTDATEDSKSLIKEIFQSLSEYSKTVEFMPFKALKNIVDEMVEESHIFKLLVLKNKLNKFEKLGYFAADNNEATNLDKILENKNVTIDVSKLDTIFQNRYILSIYSALSKKKDKPQVFIIGSNAIGKAVLKTIIMSNDIPSLLITQPRFKFINDIKTMFKNFIIEPTFSNNEVFKPLNRILGLLKNDNYLIIGECTGNLPIASTYKPTVVNRVTENKETVEKIEDAVEEIEKNDYVSNIEKKSEVLIEKLSSEIESTKASTVTDNIFVDNGGVEEEEEEEEEETNNNDSEEKQESSVSFSNETQFHTSVDETTILPLAENESAVIIDEIEEFDKEESIEEEIEQEIILESDDITENSDELIEPDYNEEANEDNYQEEIIKTDIQLSPINDNLTIANEVIDENINLSGITIEEDDSLAIAIQETNDGNDDDILNEIAQEPIEILNEEEEEEEEEEDNNDDNIALYENINSYDEIKISDDELNFSDENEDDSIILGDEDDIPEDVILVDLEEDDEQNLSEDIDKEIIEDVDKVFTTIKDESISDSDLDFIDELNGDTPSDNLMSEFEELPEQLEETTDDDFINTLEEVGNEEKLYNEDSILETKSATTPIVPVYEAEIPEEDKVMSDVIEQGDTVYHATYGNGIVEKMIKYGTKTLFSINFDNVGRRLLDPTLTEVKKA